MQSDNFLGYEKAIKEHNKKYPDHTIEAALCLIHSRRRFVVPYRLYHNKLAAEVLNRFSKIFFTDKELRDQYYNGSISEEEFLKLREKKEKPLLKQLYDFLQPYYDGTHKIRDNADLKDAVDYFMKNYDGLINYLNYSFLTPTNNCSEQMCKLVCLIRRNSLFSGSPK